MKKLKIFGTGLCLCLGFLTLTSCSNNDDNTTPVEEEPKTIIDMTEDIEEYEFSEIILDTTNVKTTFYVDDDFTYEGLKVTAVYTKDVDDQVLAQTKEITTFSVDTELVDMSTVGSYVVTVNGRSEMSQQSNTYIIHVVSRESDVSDTLYLAGLDVVVAETSTGYKDAHTVTFTQGDTFVAPIIGSSSRLVYLKGNEVSEEDCITVTSRHLGNPDTSNLSLDSDGKLNKRGSYYIIYSFTLKDVTVKSFVIVEVTNGVTGIAFTTGTTSQKATVNGFDYSDWEFTLTRETGDTEEFAYDADYITVEDVNSLVEGTYTATIKYKDEDMQASVKTTQEVTVTESDSIILIETDFSGFATAQSSSVEVGLGTTYYTRTGEEGSYTYTEVNPSTLGFYVQNSVTKEYELSTDTTIQLATTYYTRTGEEGSYTYTEVNPSALGFYTIDDVTKEYVLTTETKIQCYFYMLGGKGGQYKGTNNDDGSIKYYENDGLSFICRGKAGKGSMTANRLRVDMPSAGSIVLYCGTSGSARVLECCDSEGEVISQTTLTSSATKVIINVTEAGSYYFYSTESDLYFYGGIITYAK